MILIESQITGLINRLNDPGAAGTSTIIRLKQAQLKNWEPSNILSEGIPKEWFHKNNFTVASLRLANQIDISIDNWKWTETFQW